MTDKTVIRFTLNERIQHFLVFVAFLILFLSGFSLKYGTSEAGGFLITIMGGMGSRTLIHRIGAVLLMGIGLYHILYMVSTTRGRNQVRAVLIRKTDLANIRTAFANLFSKKKIDIQSARYTTRQKFQYWLVFFGSASMGITGLFMWFHDQTISLFSKATWNVLYILHSQEAMLVFLLILIWHLYDVHLRDAFPMDGSWLHGRMSVERLKRNHPLEYERLMQEEVNDEAE